MARPLGTLKKLERTGAIPLVSFVRLVAAPGEQTGLERLMETAQTTLKWGIASGAAAQIGRTTNLAGSGAYGRSTG